MMVIVDNEKVHDKLKDQTEQSRCQRSPSPTQETPEGPKHPYKLQVWAQPPGRIRQLLVRLDHDD